MSKLLISVRKDSPSTKANVDQLQVDLTALVFGHVNSKEPWTFYEQLDLFLGPWGDSGYPIAYGKFYCQLFNNDPVLHANLDTRDWVTKTTIKLQELIRDAVLSRFQQGKLASITEPELRSLAFATHPQAYDQGGLALVAVVAPHLLPVIASIPAVEFVPFHGNALSTWVQVLETIRRLSPEVAGYTLAAAAGPAHNGIFQKAAATSGMNAILAEQRKNAWYESQFAKVRNAIESNRLNRVVWLDDITNRLKMMPFSDPYWQQVARDLVEAADNRKSEIADFYVSLLKVHPEMRAKIDELDPPWAHYVLQPRTCQ